MLYGIIDKCNVPYQWQIYMKGGALLKSLFYQIFFHMNLSLSCVLGSDPPPENNGGSTRVYNTHCKESKVITNCCVHPFHGTYYKNRPSIHKYRTIRLAFHKSWDGCHSQIMLHILPDLHPPFTHPPSFHMPPPFKSLCGYFLGHLQLL